MKTCRNCWAYHSVDKCPVCAWCVYFMSMTVWDRSKKSKISTNKNKEVIKIEVIQKEKKKKNNIKNISRKLARELKKDIKHCEKCWDTDQLQVHHIDRDALNNTLSNLVKICFICHMKEHIDEPVYRIMKKRLEKIQ